MTKRKKLTKQQKLELKISEMFKEPFDELIWRVKK